MGLRARLLLIVLVPIALFLAAAGFLGYRTSRSALEGQLGDSLADAAAMVAAQLSAERVLALTAEDAQGEGTRTFRSLSRQLSEARAAAGLRRVVAFDRQGRVRVDAGGGLPPMSEFSELLRDSRELEAVWSGQKASSLVLFEGLDGQLYKTGYAPLLKDGQVVGAVAVEGNAAYFGPLTSLARSWTFFSVLTLGALAALAIVTARTLSRPLERLVASALRIGQGDLATQVQPEPTVEIGILARELEAMRLSLESRDRQLKMMLGGVAHEVKNPLGGMELFAGLAAEELATEPPNLPDAKSHVARVKAELEYLKRIVDDFLAFAREQKLASTRFDAAGLVQGAAGLLEGEAQTRQVALEVTAEPGVVEGDQQLLTSALVNLVKNAVQASKPVTAVKVRGRAQSGRYVLEVEDAGGGIPAELQARIFEPFFTTKEKGTGLGLPLARKLFEAHRGSLTVDSRPGRTLFRGELPLAAP